MSDLTGLRSLRLREVWFSKVSPLASVSVLLDDEALKRLASAVVVLRSLEDSEVLAALKFGVSFLEFKFRNKKLEIRDKKPKRKHSDEDRN